MQILTISGSLRAHSANTAVLEAIRLVAPSDTSVTRYAGPGALPPFNPDDDGEIPPREVAALRAAVARADAVLFVTPEYNRSVPGMLKNAIDVGSRPYGQSSWEGKPGAVISVSPGAIGAYGANHHLRQSMVFLNVPMMQQPEAYVGGAANLFDDKGQLANASTREFLGKFMQAFATWIERNAKK